MSMTQFVPTAPPTGQQQHPATRGHSGFSILSHVGGDIPGHQGVFLQHVFNTADSFISVRLLEVTSTSKTNKMLGDSTMFLCGI